MKIIKTTLGWEIQPQGADEMAHVRWLIEYFQAREVSESSSKPCCPRCSTFGNYDNEADTCLACGYGYRDPDTKWLNPQIIREMTESLP